MRVSSLIIAVSLLWVAAVATGAHHEEGETPPIQVVSAVVGGKNVFIPSTIAVVEGKPQTLSIFNATDKPHGFAIPAAGVETVLPEQMEHVVALPPMEPGIYRIHCQLHEAHRSATLVVLER